jgi:hypothetical protein
MTAVTQSMATSAAQSAAGSVAAGSAAAAATTYGAYGTMRNVAVMAAIVAAAITATSLLPPTRVKDKFSNIAEYDVYPGRLDIYFATPLEPFSSDVGGQLKNLVIERSNDFYGIERPFSRLMLNSTTLSCPKNKC